MMKTQSTIRSFVAGGLLSAMVVLALVMMTGSPARAGNGNEDNPGILPPQSKPHGKSYPAWSATWWKWALGISATNNPLKDTNGQFAAVGQSGSVWFLAGVWGADKPVVRECTVPTGKAIFFPIVNYVAVGWGWTPEDDVDAILLEWRQWLKEQVDTAQDLACEIDGKPVQNLKAYRAQSLPFSVQAPKENLFGVPELADATDALGVDDGIYLMLAPLSRGQHTIHFHAKLGDNPAMDVTYKLTVR
jgi:hypothetical protein